MFRSRISSQKPGEELYAHFKANFGDVLGASTAGTTSDESSLDAVVVDPSSLESQTQGYEELKADFGPTPRAQQDAWLLTPSPLDLDTSSFTAFANQPPGYYAPMPGWGNTTHHSQAGDLQTPRIGMGNLLGTPLSTLTCDEGVLGAPMMDLAPYPHHLSQQHFQSYSPFANPQPTQLQLQPQQQSYAPATFMHQDSGYGTMDHNDSPIHDSSRIASLDLNRQHQSTDGVLPVETN